MYIDINLVELLNNSYLCKLDTDSIKCDRILDKSKQVISLNMQLLLNSSKSDILFVESNEKDYKNLVKDGIYEGGFAVWESNWQFIKFLNCNLPEGKANALDLGCGCGFIGILAYIKGYNVCFQDMNKEVIERSLLHNFILNYWFRNVKKCNDLDKKSLETFKKLDNLILNINIDNNLNDSSQIADTILNLMIKSNWIDNISNINNNEQNSISLTCSTWENLTNNPNNVLFDYILSSETLYRIQEYSNIGNILENYLSSDGVAYFATKRFYFGIGGGTFEFIDYIQKHHNNTLHTNITKSINNKNSANIIDIIKVYKIK